LGSSVIGIVERDSIIDGAGIRVSDVVVAVASSGPHTNGYTLIRDLLRQDPSLAEAPVDATNFLEAVLEPHRCYYQSLKDLFAGRGIVGLAHITGGGIRENLNRILPRNVDAEVNLGTYQVPSVFGVIRDAGGISNDEMLRTFNLGVGLAIVCRQQAVDDVIKHLKSCGETAYVVGNIMGGTGAVKCIGSVHYRA
jgi:phosphoribosylformylglycinamidine cyclo-ligase